jgi:hypothetical protein
MEEEAILCEEAREQHSMPLLIGDLFHKTVNSERQHATADSTTMGAESRAKVAIRGGEGRGCSRRFNREHGKCRSRSLLGNVTSLNYGTLKTAPQLGRKRRH